MRAADPRAAAAAFVAAGAVPDDPGSAHRIPLVKICGIVDDAGLDAALAAGADAIGLNFVAGLPARSPSRKAPPWPAAPGPPAGPGRRRSWRSRPTPTSPARGPRGRSERRCDPVCRRGVAGADCRFATPGLGGRPPPGRRLRTRQPTARPSSSALSPVPAPTSLPAPRDRARHRRRTAPGRDRHPRRCLAGGRGRSRGPGDPRRRPQPGVGGRRSPRRPRGRRRRRLRR